MPDPIIHPASFRDPSGFIFQWNSNYYRQVNKIYAGNYDLLMQSGLYDHLVNNHMLIAHTETDEIIAEKNNWYKTLKPSQVPFITYPYEWCFAQLKDAALLTLRILKESVEYEMIIKDATPYNIQFVNGNPVFIDTLSFEKYEANNAWVAYRQFCNMFLFPLYLEHYLKADIQKTLVVYPDGIPVDITSRLLPLKSRTSLGVWLHVYLQNTVSRNADPNKETEKFSKKKLLNLADHLEATINHLKGWNERSGWSRYYSETISSKNYLEEKEKILRKMLEDIDASVILDLGANDGYFSKIAAEKGRQVIAVDNDSRSIGSLYTSLRNSGTGNILPMVMDISNPSSSTGFHNKERPSFQSRIKGDVVMALALLHHLVIGKNITLRVLSSWFNEISKLLIIEFVPPEDEKVVQMLASRKNVFQDYTQDKFEQLFGTFFHIKQKELIPGSCRTIYLMEKR